MRLATPFSKLLVANRGEVALRIFRSARRLGVRTVAVYSSADAGARHVEEADEAVLIGGPRPDESYLDIAAIVAAAKASGADAVHPGYGFLAENAAFAAACLDAGLVFVGPSPQAIEAMGHKARAKRLMAEAGVPCIPGYAGGDQAEPRLLAEAQRIGWPVMIKATSGGGGRGMRAAAGAEEFLPLLRLARDEAQGAFGNPEVMLERALVAPRHVEVQVFADRHGNVLHLGERDCSVQRRHQKLVEEAPSPAVGEALRQRMGATAVAAARAIGYEGAGTIEFLLDAAGEYYFIEANTRLQVEHPVTEEVTGLDLVEWQLRVAAGEALPLAQDEVRHKGHAIEVRLCAEDADAGFVPASGRLAAWVPPPGVRVEHALGHGSDIPPWYDSMIAKIVAHGDTREQARRRLVLALEHTVALGVTTNQSFLRRCLLHPVFAAGGATTGFVGDAGTALAAPGDRRRAELLAMAAVLLWLTGPHGQSADSIPRPRRDVAGPLRLRAMGQTFDVSATGPAEGPLRVEVQGGTFAMQPLALHAPNAAHAPHTPRARRTRLRCDGVDQTVAYARDGARLWLMHRGEVLDVLDVTLAPAAAAADGAGSRRVRASTVGRVVAIDVAAGDRVAASQALVTLEAMKMQHVHTARAAGVVASVFVAVGDQVEAGRTLVELQPEPGTAD